MSIIPALQADETKTTTAPEGVEAGTLTPEFIASLRDGYRMDVDDRARHNAVTNNEISDLALNREVVRGDDGHFSHRIKSGEITNQKQSGRCWMFAGMNVMRPEVLRRHRMEEFEFSTAYLQFWDKLEKSNLYLESVIELRDADYLDREWEIVNNWSLTDGGWWNYVTGLIEKYGVVPASVMPETHSSENTRTLNHVLERLTRSSAAKIIALHEGGADEQALREEKRKAIAEIYRFLVINLGEPPTEFEWRYKTKSKKGGNDSDSEAVTVEDENLSKLERYTPKSFYEKFVGAPLGDYVMLYNDPKNELGRHYIFDRARNMVGQSHMNFVNIGMPEMKEIAVASILANEPMWFAVNMGVDQSRELGLMEEGLYDYESLFEIDLSISKSDRTRFHSGASNHAMVLMGVDLVDGKPRKWLVENSWGKDKGDDGRWTLYDRWFDEHLYTIIVNKRHVPAETLAKFEEEPTKLPCWYPGAMGIEGKGE